MPRDTKVAAVTGTTGTGKSYKAAQVAKMLDKKNEKILVITYGGSGKTWDNCKRTTPDAKGLSFKKGWHKIHFVEWEDETDVMQEIYTHYRNGIIIFDDCRQYMGSAMLNMKALVNICIEHRHRGYDVFFVGHSPTHIPRRAWAFIKFAWLSKCTEKIKAADIPCDNPEAILEAQERANKRFDEEYQKKGSKPRGIFEFVSI